jgi:hypothetical protein
MKQPRKVKVPRPAIPDMVQRELWARSAGRCEFRGCNELLYVDDLTQKKSNLSTISHIVAYSPDGPRGDAVRSKLLEKDICNLMLTCKKHGKLMDDKAQEEAYPESLLLEFKREHEQRIKILTKTTDEAQTHVLLVNASIDERNFEINPNLAFQAILPKYSATENPTSINLAEVTISTSSDGFFSVMTEALTNRMRTFLSGFPHGRPDKSVSVFALAPIPLLVHLGIELGDIHEVDLYQRHRDKQSWTWQNIVESDELAAQFYDVLEPVIEDDGQLPIGLIISVSARIRDAQVRAIVGDKALIYEVSANEPGVDFLRSRQRLEVFGYELRRLLEEIRSKYGRSRPIHLIAAVPSPIAVELGRCIRKYHPPVFVYEYRKETEEYVRALEANQ